MAQLSKAQKKWLAGVQKALNAPGGEGISFATGGDPSLILYEAGHEKELLEYKDDPIRLVQQKGWLFDESISFPDAVEGWCI